MIKILISPNDQWLPTPEWWKKMINHHMEKSSTPWSSEVLDRILQEEYGAKFYRGTLDLVTNRPSYLEFDDESGWVLMRLQWGD